MTLWDNQLFFNQVFGTNKFAKSCRDKFVDMCGRKLWSFVCFVDFFAVSGLVTICLVQSFFHETVVRVAFNLITFGAVRVNTMRKVLYSGFNQLFFNRVFGTRFRKSRFFLSSDTENGIWKSQFQTVETCNIERVIVISKFSNVPEKCLVFPV